MSIEILVARLQEAAEESAHDPEAAHAAADRALIEYIDNEAVSAVWERIKRWYS